MVERKRGATATITKRCHATFRFRQLIETLVQKKVWRERAKDGGALPDTGCPKSRRRCQTREQLTFTGGLQQPTCISYNSCIRSTGGRLGVIPSKRAFRGGRVRWDIVVLRVLSNPSDGSRTRSVVEVVVLADFGGGSRSGSWRFIV